MKNLQTNKFRTIASLALAATMVAAILSGCGNATSSKSDNGAVTTPKAATTTAADSAKKENVTIKFENFSSSGDNEKYLKEMIDAFTADNPTTKIELQTVGYNDYFSQLMAKISSGNAPDVFELNYENFVSYASKDALYNLDEIITSTGFDKTTYNQNALSAFSAQGKQFGVPNSFSNVLMFYNKDLFDKAGVAYPTNDWTWKDQFDAAKKIRALGKDTYGIYQPVTFNELFKVAKQNGGSLFNADMTQYTIDTPANVETVQYMVDRVIKDNVMPTAEQMAGMGDGDLFKAGKLGMLLTGVWMIPDFTANTDFKWEVAVEPGNKEKATHFFSNGYCLSSGTKNAEAAFEFVSYITSNPKAVEIRLAAGWELPPVSDPAVIEKYQSLTPPDNRKAVFDSLNYLVTPPVIEKYAEFQDIMGKYLEEALTGKTAVPEAMKNCQKELQEKIPLTK